MPTITKPNEHRTRVAETRECPLCGGTGWTDTEIEDMTGEAVAASKPCRCLIWRKVRGGLGVLRTVPFPREAHLDELTAENCHIVGPWDIVAPQLRHAVVPQMWGLSPAWTFRIITDEDIRSAFFSDRPNFLRRSDPESLPDLLDPPDLLIVRVGFLAMKNKDAPGILLDALHHRKGPIWVVEDSGEPLSSCVVYSEKLEEILASWTRIEFTEGDR